MFKDKNDIWYLVGGLAVGYIMADQIRALLSKFGINFADSELARTALREAMKQPMISPSAPSLPVRSMA